MYTLWVAYLTISYLLGAGVLYIFFRILSLDNIQPMDFLGWVLNFITWVLSPLIMGGTIIWLICQGLAYAHRLLRKGFYMLLSEFNRGFIKGA